MITAAKPLNPRRPKNMRSEKNRDRSRELTIGRHNPPRPQKITSPSPADLTLNPARQMISQAEEEAHAFGLIKPREIRGLRSNGRRTG
jgi:hypothetical protein